MVRPPRPAAPSATPRFQTAEPGFCGAQERAAERGNPAAVERHAGAAVAPAVQPKRRVDRLHREAPRQLRGGALPVTTPNGARHAMPPRFAEWHVRVGARCT